MANQALTSVESYESPPSRPVPGLDYNILPYLYFMISCFFFMT